MNDVVFIVEDDAPSANLLKIGLRDTVQVELFVRAEDCLERIKNEVPLAIFLDVNLPGINGFEMCKQLRSYEHTADVPVIFISGNVGIDTRIKAYEVGGHDFIFKPVDIVELNRKVMLLLKNLYARNNLKSKLDDADKLTGLILANMDEYAILLNYLRSLNSAASENEIAALTHQMLAGFGLSGAVQLRFPQGVITTTVHGPASPIIESIIGHVQSMGRIFELKKHAVYNFEFITVLIDNMPIHDSEQCGRLRDHLAIGVETADARLSSLQVTRTNAKADLGLQQTVKILHESVAQLSNHHCQALDRGGEIMRDLLNELRVVFSHLGMNLIQEESILDLVEQRARSLIQLYDASESTQAMFKAIENQMQDIHRTLVD